MYTIKHKQNIMTIMDGSLSLSLLNIEGESICYRIYNPSDVLFGLTDVFDNSLKINYNNGHHRTNPVCDYTKYMI